jgi:hypothetical protein
MSDHAGAELSPEVQERFRTNVTHFLMALKVVLACLVFMRFYKLGQQFQRRVDAVPEADTGKGGKASGKASKEAQEPQGGERPAGAAAGDSAEAKAPPSTAEKRRARAKPA